MKLIEIKKMTKSFPIGKGEFLALKDINLEFSEGEFTGIVGPSGSGKTTLLNIIGTLDTQTKGDVIVMNQKIEELSSKMSALLRSENIGFIFQTYNLLPVYTVFENVEFPLLLLKMPKEERRKAVLEALAWVGLSDKEKSRPSQLSGGECQRVAIARAIVKKPSLVLADEPTANLDSENSHNILRTMKKLNKDIGTTFIFSTHDPKVVQYLNRKITLQDGKVANDEIVSGD